MNFKFAGKTVLLLVVLLFGIPVIALADAGGLPAVEQQVQTLQQQVQAMQTTITSLQKGPFAGAKKVAWGSITLPETEGGNFSYLGVEPVVFNDGNSAQQYAFDLVTMKDERIRPTCTATLTGGELGPGYILPSITFLVGIFSVVAWDSAAGCWELGVYTYLPSQYPAAGGGSLVTTAEEYSFSFMCVQ